MGEIKKEKKMIFKIPGNLLLFAVIGKLEYFPIFSVSSPLTNACKTVMHIYTLSNWSDCIILSQIII